MTFNHRGRSFVKKALVIAVIVLIAIQFIPVERDNPPVEVEVSAPVEVRAILRKACYDCHSHETIWPWYSKVAPVSWLIAHDVHEGRRELNFSTWNKLTTQAQSKSLSEIWEEVEEGEMPPWFYLPAHPDARLSTDDKSILHQWSSGMASAVARSTEPNAAVGQPAAKLAIPTVLPSPTATGSDGHGL